MVEGEAMTRIRIYLSRKTTPRELCDYRFFFLLFFYILLLLLLPSFIRSFYSGSFLLAFLSPTSHPLFPCSTNYCCCKVSRRCSRLLLCKVRPYFHAVESTSPTSPLTLHLSIHLSLSISRSISIYWFVQCLAHLASLWHGNVNITRPLTLHKRPTTLAEYAGRPIRYS